MVSNMTNRSKYLGSGAERSFYTSCLPCFLALLLLYDDCSLPLHTHVHQQDRHHGFPPGDHDDGDVLLPRRARQISASSSPICAYPRGHRAHAIWGCPAEKRHPRGFLGELSPGHPSPPGI